MADIVDLSSLIRRDQTVDSSVAFDDADAESHGTGDGPDTGDGLTLGSSADGLLDFGTDKRSGGSRGPVPDPTLDWSNQELADLVRVQRLLCQAGVNVATDRGVTDEGDPWFVFLDAHGEVFVHLSRIDGQYILDSTVQEGVVSGPCFATLIERFAGRAEAVASVRPDGTNVISMSRRGKIVMHPGAALAALVWSILLASEDMLFLEEPIADASADASAERTADGAPDAAVAAEGTFVADYDADTAAFRELFVDKAEAAEFLATIRTSRDGADRALQSDLRDGGQPATGVANALGVTGLGLTALAAAYGINRQQASDETEPEASAAETTVTEAGDDKAASLAQNRADTDDESALQHVAAGQLFDGRSTHAEAARSDDIHVEADAAERIPPSEAAEQALHSAAMLEAAVNAATISEAAGAGRAEPDAVSTADMAEASSPRGAIDHRGQTTEAAGNTNLARFLESVGLEDLLDSGERIVTSIGDRVGDASESLFRLIDETLTIVSVADVTERGVIVANARLLLPETNMLERGTPQIVSARIDAASPPANAPDVPLSASPYAFAQFNTDVRDFIDHLVLTSEIEVIALENQILLIDMRTVSEAGAEAFARTWSLDEERTISTIGIKADFEAFDLVA